MIDWDITLKIGGFLLTLFAVGFTVFIYNIKMKDGINRMNQEVINKIDSINLDIMRNLSCLSERIAVLETQNKLEHDLFWKNIENKIINILKSFPTNVEKDHLLDKFISKDINLHEATLLKTILEGELKITEKEKFGYILILARLEQLIYELRNETNDE